MSDRRVEMVEPGAVTRLVLASANPHKSRELREILTPLVGDLVEVVERPDNLAEVEEDGVTLEQNARLKAVAVCRATGEVAVADDSGLEVCALHGAPGVHSARYAGDRASASDNVHKLLAELEGCTDRRARFRTVVIARFPDGREVIADGVVEGSILLRPIGDGGFGYDPVFAPVGGHGRSFAQMSPMAKHALSHRALALASLVAKLGLPS